MTSRKPIEKRILCFHFPRCSAIPILALMCQQVCKELGCANARRETSCGVLYTRNIFWAVHHTLFFIPGLCVLLVKWSPSLFRAGTDSCRNRWASVLGTKKLCTVCTPGEQRTASDHSHSCLAEACVSELEQGAVNKP